MTIKYTRVTATGWAGSISRIDDGEDTFGVSVNLEGEGAQEVEQVRRFVECGPEMVELIRTTRAFKEPTSEWVERAATVLDKIDGVA